MRLLPFALLLLGLILGPLGAGLATKERSEEEAILTRALTTTAHDEVTALDAYFARARSINLLMAHGGGFVDFYLAGGRRGSGAAHREALAHTVDSLIYLEHLYPTSIGEACFIDRAGPENARAVRGHPAGAEDLSPDESRNPFFGPTFALRAGSVYQARPYVSPDTGEWVISNSTPLPMPDGSRPAIVHFEITVESFRRTAAQIGGSFGLVIVDRGTGRVVIDRDRPQRRGALLGGRSDRRFRALAGVDRSADVTMIASKRAVYQALPRHAGNANDWVVVAVSRTPPPAFLASFATAPVALLLLAIALIAAGLVSLILSRRRLTAAATTDALTGLGNRRKLDGDLARTCGCATDAEPCLFVLFDLNGFKLYNDTFGHAAGDALLVRLAANFRAAAGFHAETYRMGGDEFCLLCSGAEADRARVVADALVALSEYGEGFSVTASYGEALLPVEAAAPKDALRLADQRMYAQKHHGRPSVGHQTAAVLLQALSEREPDLGVHLDGVAKLAHRVGARLGVNPVELETITKAARLHDVGKVAIPETILQHPGPLTPDEWTFVQRHPLIGQRIVDAAPALRDVGTLIRSSHERWDGGGYPDGLAGEAIPLGARIITACDAYDAIVTGRPYARRRTPAEALAELQACAGTQFDPDVVEALAAVLDEEPVERAPRARATVGS